MEKIPCSVLVLTRNSAATLDRCLHNLQPFGEILVHDANSEDNTIEIAKKYGARVLKQYDTEEKSVRVKNFTEMRLKQRADAMYDWVIYIDSDEELTDGLVQEIGEILKTAHKKVIIKVPRLPVIDGKIRTRGLLYPEVMPRVHHRKGGCTLQAGKAVHEKYEYDKSFTEVVTKNPLLFPLPSVKELRRKDDRYITLEAERVRDGKLSFSHYLRWILLREPFIIFSLAVRTLLYFPRYFDRNAVPFEHEWRYVSYHSRLFRAVTGEMIARVFRR